MDLALPVPRIKGENSFLCLCATVYSLLAFTQILEGIYLRAYMEAPFLTMLLDKMVKLWL